ncbi:TPA: hypothetical protein RK455_002711 [Enterobacter ludwigii]|uniref:hypothetical protein n=1 Tax=Enterobacter ludwigii TaxID=299767 RepID=UPI0018C2FE6B|nr:hypothetical protein [Enterobacter ludwigii]MBG0584205.1 hypothetical protein [Enterobacter ludwigii]HDW2025878.1 hypothetical protein [Enterobacter ludwigii]
MTNNNLTDERLSVLIRVARDSLELYEMELPVIDDVMLALAELQQRRASMLQGGENAESPSGNSQVIHDGWVMVPVEPTEEMLAELCLVKGWTARALNARYQAMLAAAPKPEA